MECRLWGKTVWPPVYGRSHKMKYIKENEKHNPSVPHLVIPGAVSARLLSQNLL